MTVLKVAGNPADLGTKHVAVAILKKHCGMVGLGGEHDKDKRRHHVRSANSISAVIMSTLLSTFLTLPQRANLQALRAELPIEDYLVCVADDTKTPIHDARHVSTRQLV
eukprot:2997416-Amphidinium_carterae.1